jgi:translation initiation factor 2B subunit (eIF-2B alpha/beta/delta family)
VNLDALVAPLRADVVSGAAMVSRAAAEITRRVAVRAPAADAAGLRRVLADLAIRMLDAQPAMAPLVSLTSRVLSSLDDAPDLEAARREAARAAEAFRGEIEERTGEVGRRAAKLLPATGRVLTVSSSSTVRAALIAAGTDGALEVVCLESRPAGEGQTLARTLAAAGFPVVYGVDAAAEALAAGASVALLGADSIGDDGVVNKIGSRALARAARAQGAEVWVLADGNKLLPPGFPQAVADDRPADEVWPAPVGVKVWNQYFEVVPDSLVDRVVTESGALSLDEVHHSRRRLPVPAELAAWASWRRGGAGRSDFRTQGSGTRRIP